MPVDTLACPSWCVVHRLADPAEPGDQGTHYGRTFWVALNEDEAVEQGVTPGVLVQLTAYDADGERSTGIDLVDPSGTAAEMTSAEARALAAILISGADMRSLPASDGCPSWCEDHHPDLPPDGGIELYRGMVHYGPAMTMTASGPALSGVLVKVQVSVRGEGDRQERDLALAIAHAVTGATSAQAYMIATNLLDVADLCDAG
ncbi:DUF6907 domain-containing protein [Nocardia aurea]|uniref:DUF6907 domain-containing protein n=1 Tax=Nocardia aurea TaxID=2144174 RepID=UPI0013002F3F|nr:hypothetical protein [Nocardia aurea]